MADIWNGSLSSYSNFFLGQKVKNLHFPDSLAVRVPEVMGNQIYFACDLEGEKRVTFIFSEKHSGGGFDF